MKPGVSAVKKTISLPPDLSRAAEEIARAEGKTLSAVVQEALRQARASRLRDELAAQGSMCCLSHAGQSSSSWSCLLLRRAK